ncbi:MAG: hypothetical protein M9939_01225 [Mesorhizobium sp.]|nr:hypothetical protein [Mesorhizobium sp.]MCO5159729.1 hypothetical protein [Mesorhizobium sp.]
MKATDIGISALSGPPLWRSAVRKVKSAVFTDSPANHDALQYFFIAPAMERLSFVTVK